MKVKDLIDKLLEFDSNTEVYINDSLNYVNESSYVTNDIVIKEDEFEDNGEKIILIVEKGL